MPIRPRWAEQLFDTELPQTSLFGKNPLLTLCPENAYYRSAKPHVLSAPARVLWYVSDPATPGAMSLRANSYIDEVVVDGPKEVFRRFRRLGIYSWNDVFKTAEHDLTKKIMAFQFSKTELFRNPVRWERMQEILMGHIGKENPLVSPVQIPEACFLELYRMGMYGA